MNRSLALLLGAVLAISLPATADEKGHDHGTAPGQLGEVSFPTSCTPAAQKHFERGVAWVLEQHAAGRRVFVH